VSIFNRFKPGAKPAPGDAMHTRPAPLDHMSTAGDDDVAQFRVNSPREIGTILKQLLDGSTLLNLHAVNGMVLTSAIWTMDSARGTIGFNADPRDLAVKALMESHEVVVVGYIDNVKLQFEVHGLMLVNGQRASALDCAPQREVSMRLTHVTPIKAETGGVRLGFEFDRIGGEAVRTLQRFIDLTQKRAKLMALN
jgi:hypothetical protein